VTQQAELAAAPLTALAEDEILFRDSVRQFAETQIKPLVREMDEHAKMPRPLVDELFALGVMGVEIPEAYGGGGASFFHSVLAVEAISAVDPSVANPGAPPANAPGPSGLPVTPPSSPFSASPFTPQPQPFPPVPPGVPATPNAPGAPPQGEEPATPPPD